MGFLEPALNFIKRLATLLARLLELAITGQSEYKLYTSEIADFEAVTDALKAKLLRTDTEVFLRRNLGISLAKPLVLQLYSGDIFDLKGILMELNGNLGRYYYEKMGKSGMVHMVYVLKGLQKKRFKAVLAHEMAHAFLREEDILKADRAMREGFARWVEYKILQSEGMEEEARKIRNLKTYRYGKAVNRILALEKEVGQDSVIDSLRSPAACGRKDGTQ